MFSKYWAKRPFRATWKLQFVFVFYDDFHLKFSVQCYNWHFLPQSGCERCRRNPSLTTMTMRVTRVTGKSLAASPPPSASTSARTTSGLPPSLARRGWVTVIHTFANLSICRTLTQQRGDSQRKSWNRSQLFESEKSSLSQTSWRTISIGRRGVKTMRRQRGPAKLADWRKTRLRWGLDSWRRRTPRSRERSNTWKRKIQTWNRWWWPSRTSSILWWKTVNISTMLDIFSAPRGKSQMQRNHNGC